MREVRVALRPLATRRVMATLLLVVSLSTVGLLALSGASMWWTSQPSFCGKCHPMKPFIDQWAVSTHRTVNCEKCHTTPGLFGFIGGKIAGLQVVANYFRGDYRDWSFNAVVSNAACLECHESIMEKSIHKKGKGLPLVVSHENIVKAGGKCNFCHSTVAHGKAVPPGSQTHPSMSACVKCHNGKIAPLRCSMCHPGTRGPLAARESRTR